MTSHQVCKICIMEKGLKGIDLIEGKCDYAFQTEDDFIKHLKEKHGIIVGKRKKKNENSK